MKKALIFLISLFVFILANPFVLATPNYSLSRTKSCPYECIEGRYVNFDVSIKNTGSSDLELVHIEIRDDSDKRFAYKYNINNGMVPGEEVSSENVVGYLPPPTGGTTLYYKICFYLKERHWWGWDSGNWYCNSGYQISVTSAGDIDCDYDFQCADNQKCTNHKCVAVSCDYCQYISNHKCYSYNCCSDSDCSSNYYCEGHDCKKVSCSCGKIENHKCMAYECCYDSNCPENHYCSNHDCIEYECTEDSDCNYDQYCYNRDCKSLNCGYGNYPSNHECVEYDCMEDVNCDKDEYCSNHNCLKLSCKNDEYVSNHACVKHECMEHDDCESYYEFCSKNKCTKWDRDITGFVVANPIFGAEIGVIILAICGIIYWKMRKNGKLSKEDKKIVKKEEEKK